MNPSVREQLALVFSPQSHREAQVLSPLQSSTKSCTGGSFPAPPPCRGAESVLRRHHSLPPMWLPRNTRIESDTSFKINQSNHLLQQSRSC